VLSAVTVSASTLDIKGADIKGNSGAYSISAEGITVNAGGSVSLSSGTISGFGAAGVVLSGSTSYFYMKGGTISNNFNGGVMVNSNAHFNMIGGTIRDNYGALGGGVKVTEGLFTMTEPAVITHNSAYQGGGVFIMDGGTFTMNSGTISDNTVTNGGGGVQVYDQEYAKGNRFNMSGGIIRENMANRGAGVYVGEKSKFAMSGYGPSSTFNITGNNRFDDSVSVTEVAGVWIVRPTTLPGQFVKTGGTITAESPQSIAVVVKDGTPLGYDGATIKIRNTTAGVNNNLDVDTATNWY
jgi:hypothetical protein